jgi:hypothetical protein
LRKSPIPATLADVGGGIRRRRFNEIGVSAPYPISQFASRPHISLKTDKRIRHFAVSNGRKLMDADMLVVSVSAQGIAAADLRAALLELSGDQTNVEIRLPRPAPGGLPMLDPGAVQMLIHSVSHGGAIAGAAGISVVAVKAAFGVLEKWVVTHNTPLKIKIGTNTIEVPPNISGDVRDRVIDSFMSELSKRRR